MKKDFILLLLLILPSFSWLLQPGYLTMHDDLQAVRQLEMDKCFSDGQIPCRWVLDLGYGYGYPLFNFYPPLPYLLGQVFRSFGMPYIDVVKAVGVTGFIVTALFMYLLSREFWGRKGAFISTLIYTYAPYHSVDFYVRGAMNEFWAMAFFPLIFWSSYRLIKDMKRDWIVLLGLAVAGLMLSHNLMLMIFAPVLVVWCLYWMFRFKSLVALKSLILSALIAFGLAAFFTLPVLFEQKYAHVETLTIGYFNFLAHFLDIKQIFLNINWDYGESRLGDDTMSFALGYLQWILPLIALVLSLFVKKLKNQKSLIIILVMFSLSALFLSHFKATPIWKILTPLQFLQFPWRFLTLAVFSASLAAGSVGLIKNGKLAVLIMVLAIAMNGNYFRPRVWYPDMTDAKKFSGDSWRLQVTGSIFDYLPIQAPLPPADPASSDAAFIVGEGQIKTLEKRTNYQKYLVIVTTPKSEIEIQTFYFPGWQVWLNKRQVVPDYSSDRLLGRMRLPVGEGYHVLEARFVRTPIRLAGDLISAVTWSALLLLAFIRVATWLLKKFLSLRQ